MFPFPHHIRPAGRRVSPRAEWGFTLLELLVVIMIIALISGSALLSLGRLGSGGEAEDTARRIAALLRLGSDESVLNAREIGLYLDRSEYRFLVYQGGVWLPVENDKLFQPHSIPAGLELELAQHGESLRLPAPPDEEDEAESGGADNGQDGGSAENAAGESQQPEESDGHPPPQILLLSSGEISPFELYVSSGTDEDAAVWIVRGALTGEIRVERRE